MTPAFQVLLCLCLLGLSCAAPKARNVRWCVTSAAEQQKCNDLVNSCTVKKILLICVKKSSTEDCMRAIRAGEADAISLDSEDIYKASLNPFQLKPIMTETYYSQKDIKLNQDLSQKERQHLLEGGQPLLGAFEPKSDEKESTPCLRDRQRVLGAKKPRIGAFVPECDEKGNYVPKQCYGSTGYCWCVDEHGEERAAGRARQGKANITCEYTASEMPCMKERRNVLSGGQPLLGAFVPDCDEKGNYIPKQCHGSTGYCWCVDENGADISGSKTPPGQPTPTCGASAGATCIKERYKVLGAGQPLVGAFIPDCDEEGHYRPMQCHDSTGSCWCVSKDGVEIQGTRTAPGKSPPSCEVPDLVKCHYAVAVVKKSSTLQFNQLKGKRSCHSAVGTTAGWIAPLHALFKEKLLLWEGREEKSFEKAVSEFFSASCAPGAKEENLCQQCAGQEDKCKRGPGEPYYGDEGAFRCLREDKGDVAFVEDIALSGLDSDNFELLCPDNTRSPLSEHKDCNFGKVPTHAVVTRSTGDKTKDIIEYVLQAQKKECKLFSFTHGEDLVPGDTTTNLTALPSGMDTFLFLGPELFNAMKTLQGAPLPSKNEIRWCTQNKKEKIKCDVWSAVSGGAIKCTKPSTVQQCIQKILKREADAVTLSAEHAYTALKCGLVPAVEGYHNKDDFSPCNIDGDFYADFGGTAVVALVKKSDKDITWNNLKGKNSCHTGVGHWAGWMLPVSLISKQTKNCDIGSYFNQSCAPGSAINSNLCKLCIGDPRNTKAQTRCSLSDKEAYYGDAGAIRCLVEKGDVAFVTNSAVIKNTDGNNPAPWAKDLKSTDFELLCPDGSRAPVSDYRNCDLPGNPGPSVVTREESVGDVVKIFLNQQSRFGRNGLEKDKFQMYSSYGENVLFSDDTQCMIAFDRIIGRDIIEDILGKDFSTAMIRENPCLAKSELRTACTFRAEKI